MLLLQLLPEFPAQGNVHKGSGMRQIDVVHVMMLRADISLACCHAAPFLAHKKRPAE
jgi:hypothetical protein